MNKIQKELNQRVTIKNVKTMEGRDGLVINCDLYLDNKKVARYHDPGQGGGGMIDAYPIKSDYTVNRAKLKEVEDIISKLPAVKSDFNGADLQPDIDWVVEEMITLQKFEKKMKKFILVGVPTESILGMSLPKDVYNEISWRGVTDLTKLEPAKLKAAIARVELKKDEVIFNTNLPI